LKKVFRTDQEKNRSIKILCLNVCDLLNGKRVNGYERDSKKCASPPTRACFVSSQIAFAGGVAGKEVQTRPAKIVIEGWRQHHNKVRWRIAKAAKAETE